MASEPILNIEEDIDDRILAFCEHNPTLEPQDVLRDIARIVCILNLVRLGEIDGKTRVLCGGMAMRCLDSPRMSIYDADTASLDPIDVDAMRDSITYDEEDIAITAGATEPGKDLVSFQPVDYDARFSDLPGATDQFSISFAYRGLELKHWRAPFNHRYPFALLGEEMEVPIMHPHEILAEKIVAWWLFGHAKHYNDIAFLGLWLRARDEHTHPKARRRVRGVVEKKLAINRTTSTEIALRVDALTPPVRRERLESPDDHVDPKRNFNTLSYLTRQAPAVQAVRVSIDRIILPLLFD